MGEEEINLKKFDTSTMSTHFCACLIGPLDCAKYVLLDELLFKFHKTFDIIIGISPNETSLVLIKKYTPKASLYKTYNIKEINLIISQLIETAKSFPPENKFMRILIVIDECGKKFLKNNETILQLYIESRHLNICTLSIIQQCNDINVRISNQFSHVFGFRQNESKLNELLFTMENNNKNFNDLYKKYTKNYGCLVSIRDQKFSHYSDVLKWYKINLNNYNPFINSIHLNSMINL